MPKSLSRKILLYFVILFAGLVVSSYLVTIKLMKEHFYQIEMEKAQMLTDTFAPIIGLDLFLGLKSDIHKILTQLKRNPDVLAVKLTQGEKVVLSFQKKAKGVKDYFVIKKDIYQPNSNHKIARMELIYSSSHYQELVKKFQHIVFLLSLVASVLLVIFAFFLYKLLLPLRKIAKKLEKYDPQKKPLKLEFVNRADEIGMISKAIGDMQEKINSYANRLENMNKILELKVEEKTKELKEQLFIDNLTKLPNRYSLLQDLTKRKKDTLVIINIDDFKSYNDLFGQVAGDKILLGFANRLKLLLQSYPATLYRLSGDEFAILMDSPLSKEDVKKFIAILLRKIENIYFLHNENELNIRVTMGIAIDEEKPLEKADIALKLARKERVSYKIYEKSFKVEKEYQNNIKWIREIKQAIREDRIVPFFQPLVNTQTLMIKGYETLMRMRGREGDIISPFHFLEIAKKSRYYKDLTKIMFEKSCKTFAPMDCSFSFNLSIEDIINDEVIFFIEEEMKKYQIEKRVVFEIVESEGIENFSQVLEFIERMKRRGAQISIDDFGTGYSNFEYLAKLPIDYIKIDGSLIKEIDKNENARVVVETIVDYAKKREIKTVAEFVSRESLFQVVSEIGIDYAQGYLVGEPSEQVDICGG